VSLERRFAVPLAGHVESAPFSSGCQTKQRMNLIRTFLVTLLFTMSGFIASAQTLQHLVSFNGTNGEFPVAALTLGSDGNYYGTTQYGGDNLYSGL
jgi:hypothetical protein